MLITLNMHACKSIFFFFSKRTSFSYTAHEIIIIFFFLTLRTLRRSGRFAWKFNIYHYYYCNVGCLFFLFAFSLPSPDNITRLWDARKSGRRGAVHHASSSLAQKTIFFSVRCFAFVFFFFPRRPENNRARATYIIKYTTILYNTDITGRL